MKKPAEIAEVWKPAKPDATMGSLAGTLGTPLRTPFESLAARVHAELAVNYPDVREAHGAVFRHLPLAGASVRSEEHTSELQSLMRISYAVFCLKKKNKHTNKKHRIGT